MSRRVFYYHPLTHGWVSLDDPDESLLQGTTRLLGGIPRNPRSVRLRLNSGELVGAIGFEPTTPCAQGRCATRLRYAPTLCKKALSDYS